MPDCLRLPSLFRVARLVSLLFRRRCWGTHTKQGGHGACHETQALGEAQVLLNHRRDVKTGRSEVVRVDDRAVIAPVRIGAAAPHEAVPQQPYGLVLGEAEQRLLGLGGVAAVGGHAAGRHSGGLWSRGAGSSVLRAAVDAASGPFPPSTSGHRKCGTEALNVRVPSSRISSSSTPQPSLKSSWLQADTNFARAELRWAVKRHGPEVVVVIATEVASLFPVSFSLFFHCFYEARKIEQGRADTLGPHKHNQML